MGQFIKCLRVIVLTAWLGWSPNAFGNNYAELNPAFLNSNRPVWRPISTSMAPEKYLQSCRNYWRNFERDKNNFVWGPPAIELIGAHDVTIIHADTDQFSKVWSRSDIEKNKKAIQSAHTDILNGLKLIVQKGHSIPDRLTIYIGHLELKDRLKKKPKPKKGEMQIALPQNFRTEAWVRNGDCDPVPNILFNHSPNKEYTAELDGVATRQKKGLSPATVSIIHEIGHILHERHAGKFYWDERMPGELNAFNFITPTPNTVKSFSNYASKQGREFVPEMFAADIIGYSQGITEELLTYYGLLNGPPLSASSENRISDGLGLAVEDPQNRPYIWDLKNVNEVPVGDTVKNLLHANYRIIENVIDDHLNYVDTVFVLRHFDGIITRRHEQGDFVNRTNSEIVQFYLRDINFVLRQYPDRFPNQRISRDLQIALSSTLTNQPAENAIQQDDET